MQKTEVQKTNVSEFSVSEISSTLKNILETNFEYIRIKGEVADIKKAASGHIYFSLKDENAVINVVCWKGVVPRLKNNPEDGLEVVASGKISTFSKNRSNYYLMLSNLEIKGEGALLKLLEDRKKKLFKEGLFDKKHKLKLPKYPKKIGIITSKTGAVIEDMLHRIKDRFPLNVILYPANVQGTKCALEIRKGIVYFNKRNNQITTDLFSPKNTNIDLIVIARGGGSLEDLYPFNDENLIREVFKSKIPIVSAIGHEPDHTLLDLVSDLRAPTPTASIELCLPVLKDEKEKIQNLFFTIKQHYQYLINNFRQSLFHINKKIKTSSTLINPLKIKLDNINYKIISTLKNLLSIKKIKLNENLKKITKPNISSKQYELNINYKKTSDTIIKFIDEHKNKLNNLNVQLESFYYKKTLSRGFAIIKNNENKIITSIKDLTNEEVKIIFKDGIATAKITKLENK